MKRPESRCTPAIQTWADAIKAAAKINSVAVTSEPLHLSDAKQATVLGTNPSGVFAYYATNFTAKAPMVATTDKDSGNAVLNTPSGAKSVTAVDAASTDTTLGTATVTVNIANAGTFNFYGLVNGPAANTASFYLKIDNGPLNPWLFKTNAGLYTWEVAAGTVGGTALALNLSAGTHTIEIRQREAGAQISRLVLSTVAKFDPSTAQATSRQAKLLALT